MIGDFCALLRSLSFNGVEGVHSHFLPQGDTTPAIVVTRTGTDRLDVLGIDDHSLEMTDVQIDVTATKPSDACTIAAAVADYLDTHMNVAMGDNVLEAAIVNSVEDFQDAPQDASDNWLAGTRLMVTVQHSPA